LTDENGRGNLESSSLDFSIFSWLLNDEIMVRRSEKRRWGNQSNGTILG
jgi:hypothetical protein